MKPLRSFLDKLHPSFDKGGKFEKTFPSLRARGHISLHAW